MLDTYEDLPEAAERERALNAFAARMGTMQPPPPLPAGGAHTDRDRAQLLLVRRCGLVDQAFATLGEADRGSVVDLVQNMADGMIRSSRRLADQGGVLVDQEQVAEYCHHVMGGPALFALQVTTPRSSPAVQSDVLAVGEFIQLANITRDIERDLARGIGYHPVLAPHLGAAEAREPIAEARRQLMRQALPQVSAYVRLAGRYATRPFSLARAAAVLMLLHTDRHYRWCAERVGQQPWRGPNALGSMLGTSLAAAVSPWWSRRVMQRVEHDLLEAARVLGP
jgi:phytoene/squalene synthetase